MVSRGSWLLEGYFITLLPWHFNFPLSQQDIVHHFPTWVQVHGLSLKYYNMETTKYIGDKLGKFICYDEKSPFNGFGLHLKIFSQIWGSMLLICMIFNCWLVNP